MIRKIAVCIKQIPLVEDANFDPVTKTVRRDGPAVISAFDLRAISLAVELKKRFDASVAVVTMGPPQARNALIDALAMGMDRAVHLEDRAFAGSDTLATARALAMWLKRERFDLILLGKYSLDAETGQVGPEIAELLGIAQVTGVRKLEIDGDKVHAERESDEGYEEIECRLPALLTCAERVASPIRLKPDTVENARTRAIESVCAADLDPDLNRFGFLGSPTWVREVRTEEPQRTECRMIDGADPVRAASQIVAALNELGALPGPARRPPARRQIGTLKRTAAKGRDLWVACETNLAGEVTRGSLELLSRGDELATSIGGALIAVGLPSLVEHASMLASYGADRVLIVDSPTLVPYTPEACAEAMAALVREREPWGLLICASERGRDWGPRMAARLELGLTGDAIAVELDAETAPAPVRMVALKPAFGGNIVAPILSKTYPQMATVRAGVLAMAEPNGSRKVELEQVRLELKPPLSRLVKEHTLLDPSVKPLEGAELVVGIGMGVGAEGVERVKDLARALGAGVCATRQVTDAGWVPRQLQVGLTGKTIDPRLYITVGIRGGPNHLVGIKRAQTVVAINNDPEAPIFERATIGVVADWAKLVPRLTWFLRARIIE